MPFDDLPLEIIQHIFSLRCRRVKFRIPHELHEPDRRLTQVTLSLVCSRWREIVLNTGALWGQVEVIYNASGEQAQGPTASFQSVQDWLNRAGMSSISLYISVHEASESQTAAVSQTLLSSFHVTNLDLKSDHSFLLVPTNNSSRLERLHLSLSEPARTTDVFPRLPEMPSLKELHLCLRPGDFVDIANIYLIPWHQLRVFTLSENHWPSQMLFNILQRCKSLVKCILFVMPEYEQLEHDIVLPNLESLVLYMDLERCADPIIRSLTLPNLRSLSVTALEPETGLLLSSEAIVIMAQRSGFNKRLTNLSLCWTEEPVDLKSLLGSMLALERVFLAGLVMFKPGTFDDLSSGTIGPHLEVIYFAAIMVDKIALLLETVGQRHEKAKTPSDIRPFASITCGAIEDDIQSLQQQAEQCRDAFNARVYIIRPRPVSQDVLLFGTVFDSGESDSDFSMGSASDEESYLDEESSVDEDGVSVSDEESLEESHSDEESYSLGESESHGESYDDSSSESHWESDPDIGLDSHSGEESDPASDDAELET